MREPEEFPHTEAEVRAIISERDALAQKLETAQKQIDHLEARVEGMTHQRDQALEKLHAAETQLADLEKSAAQIEEDHNACVERLKAEVEGLKKLTLEGSIPTMKALERRAEAAELQNGELGSLLSECADYLVEVGHGGEIHPTHEFWERMHKAQKRYAQSRPESFAEKRVRAIPIGADGMCTCSCADWCPLGRTGSARRCTKRELEEAGHKTGLR